MHVTDGNPSQQHTVYMITAKQNSVDCHLVRKVVTPPRYRNHDQTQKADLMASPSNHFILCGKTTRMVGSWYICVY